MFTATERLYLTADGRIVKEGDPEAYSLFVHAGGYVPFQLAAQYNLTAAETPPPPPDEPTEPEGQEHKARSSPPTTKHRAGPSQTK